MEPLFLNLWIAIKVMLHVEDDVSEQGAKYGEDEEEQICMVDRAQEMAG